MSRISGTQTKSGLRRDASRNGPSIVLVDGSYLYFDNPDPAVMSPLVIGHALSHLCRWTGQCNVFFSVAQHTVIVSKIVSPEHAMAGLMHDASEAFIGDVSRPLKYALETAAPGMLSSIEDRLHAALAERYGFVFPFHSSVKHADTVSLATERRDILPPIAEAWTDMPDPLPEKIVPMSPAHAERTWLSRFVELGGSL